jgi:mxaA protein
MDPRPLRVAGCLLALAAGTACGQTGPAASVVEPRAFGYRVGDVLQRRIALQVPDGMTLDRASLPRAGRPGQPLELRSVSWSGAGALVLEYQVFLSPPAVRTLELPPLRLRFSGPAGERVLRIEPWPVTVAPLVPVDAPSRAGLGEMRPDAPPPPIDTTAVRRRLWAYAGALALAAGYLAHVYFGLGWRGRRARPFADAWRALRSGASAPPAEQRRAAFVRLHEALNASAGEALFESGLDRFVAAQPAFAPLRAELAEFFRRSRDEFFAGRGRDQDLPWLRQLCRACRDAERGGA